eukprot:TRINITY_DN16023_c0_g1_i11.p1 TRINITY_DN16023_c0_g1~~TRINITY_DN16023_c0_g1_i11.p1  ORF type:complete len:135 (+),score=10.08 TRINITY_DN16023_c0_g1_i11:92-496(+)
MLDCIIVNGACAGDIDGEFTYVSPHGNSVIDYFIISKELFSSECRLHVGDRVDSWHLPVEYVWKKSVECTSDSTQRENEEECIIWSEDHLLEYVQELDSHECFCGMQEAHQALSVNVNKSVELLPRLCTVLLPL